MNLESMHSHPLQILGKSSPPPPPPPSSSRPRVLPPFLYLPSATTLPRTYISSQRTRLHRQGCKPEAWGGVSAGSPRELSPPSGTTSQRTQPRPSPLGTTSSELSLLSYQSPAPQSLRRAGIVLAHARARLALLLLRQRRGHQTRLSHSAKATSQDTLPSCSPHALALCRPILRRTLDVYQVKHVLVLLIYLNTLAHFTQIPRQL